MKIVETHITVAASPTHVWNVLTDFRSYGEWNPFFVAVDGVARPGEKLALRTKFSKRLKPQTFIVKVQTSDAPRKLLWSGGLPIRGIADGAHGFDLTPADGGTEVRHYEKFSGVLVPVVGNFVTSLLRPLYDDLNQALKKRAEQTA